MHVLDYLNNPNWENLIRRRWPSSYSVRISPGSQWHGVATCPVKDRFSRRHPLLTAGTSRYQSSVKLSAMSTRLLLAKSVVK